MNYTDTLMHVARADDPAWGLASADLEGVLSELAEIREKIIADSAASLPLTDEVHARYRASAQNLLHYLALRRHDLRMLQVRLASLGLSSLDRSESHVLATLDAVLHILRRLQQCPTEPPWPQTAMVDHADAARLLTEHTEALFGPTATGRMVRIMVTMPSEAGDDYLFIYNLLKNGMDCMRINCAHDNPATWLRMIAHLRRAERSIGRSCRVVMDLVGPRPRTGQIAPGPAVVRIRPRRDVYGHVSAPARIWLTTTTFPGPSPSPADACLPVPAPWLKRLRAGDRVRLRDARHARRTFRVDEVTGDGCWAHATKTTYVVPGTILRHSRSAADRAGRAASVGILPSGNNAIRVRPGDMLILTRDLRPGCPATFDSGGRVRTPAAIGCTMPEVFDDVRPGEPIWFDDGKIGGVVEEVESTRVLVRITHAHSRSGKLLGGKGINLPESALRPAAMTAKDVEDLAFVARHADVVGLSFANTAQDVEMLQRRLAQLGGRQPAVVLKIETRRGFENLPAMLRTAMRSPCCGVMIARGDLAIECGFERLPEIQDEILRICAAAHVPVILATQVLETLAKKGLPSRAEITDAALAQRADCVMLNKGPHVLSAARVLDNILRRMQARQGDKCIVLAEPRSAQVLSAEPSAGLLPILQSSMTTMSTCATPRGTSPSNRGGDSSSKRATGIQPANTPIKD
jgi:pyruvate kinase